MEYRGGSLTRRESIQEDLPVVGEHRDDAIANFRRLYHFGGPIAHIHEISEAEYERMYSQHGDRKRERYIAQLTELLGIQNTEPQDD